MTAYLRDLKSIFSSFCQFGASKGGSFGDIASPTRAMDNARFAKFAKDSNILDMKLTMTDIDIVFNKIKNKGSRRLEFEEFIAAIKELSNIKYPGATDAFSRLAGDICRMNQGPIAVATIPANDSTVKRLTDVSKYTGTHKMRFDSNGKGLGLLGRDQPSQTDSLEKITNRKPSTVRGIPVSAAVTAANGTSLGVSKPSSARSLSDLSRASTFSGPFPKRTISKSGLQSQEGLENPSTKVADLKSSESDLSNYSAKNSNKGDIFRRLTDVSKYTGVHKARFNPDGTGRGLAGRVSVMNATTYHGGDVKSLAQILRH